MFQRITSVLRHNMDTQVAEEKKELRAKFRKEILITKGFKKVEIGFRKDDYEYMMMDKKDAELQMKMLPTFE